MHRDNFNQRPSIVWITSQVAAERVFGNSTLFLCFIQ